jgi:hypothetical protein
MERGCIEPTIRLDRPAILAELHHIFRHVSLIPDRMAIARSRPHHLRSPQ